MDSSMPQWKYDVFISFRGVDTRKSFTDHLYTALDRKGFNIFRDHESLERGKEISPELLKAIEESKISIIIFSKNYASSSWCLDELVKIVECKEQKAQKAYPIFYNVDPSDVRKAGGEFKEAFDKHEKNDKKKAEIWRHALVKIAAIGGWDSRDRLESQLIQDIVEEISKELRLSPVLNRKDLVGIEARLEKLKIHLTECSNSVCIVGICGMGGIGKTTIARVMYELISHEFEDNKKLWMHDLLQEMGQQIVKRESLREPGKRSRLWKEEDVYHVLTKNTGTEAIEGMVLDFCDKEVPLSAKAFSKMINLRLLKVINVQLSGDLEYLSNELRLIKWQGYPLKSLPSNLRLDKTIELKISCSPIEQLWKGTQPLSELKSISIIHSCNLKKTPDFTGVPNLEELILEGCSRLHEIHPSLAIHKKLILLNLKDCKRLTTLPGKIGMTSLRKLILSGCSKFKIFPEIVGDMGCLLEIFLDGTAIKELPSSVECLTGLVLLNLKGCNNLKSLPSNLNGLKSLKILNLSGCSKLENLPQNVGQVESLEELDISGTARRQRVSSIFRIKNLKVSSFGGSKGTPCKSWYPHVPPFGRSSDSVALKLPSLSSLCSLTKLDLSDCNLWDGALLGDLGSLFSLEELNLSKNNFISLPASINRLSRLQNLKLEECKRLKFIPELPSSINTVRLDACSSLETISDALKLCNSEWLVISCLNCLKLLDANSMVSSMLKQYLKVISSPKNEFSIVVHGSEIPEWFSHQREGSSISIQRPPHVNDDRNLLGYAVCSVFSVNQHPSAVSDVFGTHKLFCHLKTDGELSSTSHFTHFEEKFGRAVSDHLWLLYISHCEYLGAEGHNECNNIEFSFASQWGPGLEVKKCGVHPIYDQEMAGLDQTMN